MIEPYNKRSLLKALGSANDEVTDTLKSLSLDDLYDRPEQKWSPADTLRHLTLSVKPLYRALLCPRFILRLRFGKPERPSARYHQVRELYQKRLSQGAQASGRYLPRLLETPPTQAEAERERYKLIMTWKKTGKALIRTAQNWREMDFDRHFLPHPILGKLTIREMLMFTLYHNLHHVYRIQQRFQKTHPPAE